MGIYTDSHGNTYSINIGDPELLMISNNPDFHFCWMNENDSIRDTKSNYYEEKTDGDETRDVLKESITVTTAASETVTGRVWHMVSGPCSGTHLRNWFIICTEPYPYNRNRKQAWG